MPSNQLFSTIYVVFVDIFTPITKSYLHKTLYMNKLIGLMAMVVLLGCKSTPSNVPVIGFVDAFEDNTIAQAKKGFFDALAQKGYSESKGNIKVIYRNAQGSIPTLTQIVKYMQSEQVTLLATCPSLSTVTAVQSKTKIPIFMMVAPMPNLMKITDANGKAPANLFGVGENLAYIDTSFLLIPTLLQKPQLTVGMIFNQSEPQSVEAIERIKSLAANNNINLVYLPVNTSADVQLVTQSLLNKKIDAFFANPDNTVFASFETIAKACNQAKVPIFTSEAGLVSRGAVAAFGADIYDWGFQSGEQAADFLAKGNTNGLTYTIVKTRKRVYNATVAATFGLKVPATFQAIQ